MTPAPGAGAPPEPGRSRPGCPENGRSGSSRSEFGRSGSGCSGTGSGPGSRPARKILVIVADQLRADALGAYGNPAAPTPHLDALAARGALFEQHYSTSAPCGPRCRSAR